MAGREPVKLGSGAASLKKALMTVKMSDMRSTSKRAAELKKARSSPSVAPSFSLRDLNRQPAKVLAACDLHGTVRLRTRGGRSYSLKRETSEPDRTAKVESLVARRQRLRQQLRAAGFVPPSPAEMERINRIIAGEE